MSTRLARRLAVLISAGAAAFALALGALPASAVSGPAPATLSTADPRAVVLGAKNVARGLSQPTCVRTAADGTNRIFVCEKQGRVRLVTNGSTVAAAPYLDLRSLVSTAGERGLLDIAFAPDFATRPWVFVSYTDTSGSLVVARFIAASPTASRIDARTRATVMIVPHPGYSNHNGGSLAFDSAGLLYVGTGDGGGGGDPGRNAQDLRSLLGKILRIDPFHSCDGGRYCVPAGNPWADGVGARPQIWVFGLRNPWRTSVDHTVGTLWIGDVGQDRYEEVDAVPVSGGGISLGWSCLEARFSFATSHCPSGRTHVGPRTWYPHAQGESITGGYVYRGRAYASRLAGLYVFGDFISGATFVYSPATGVRINQRLRLPGVTAFGESDGRELYAVTFDGRLWRLTA